MRKSLNRLLLPLAFSSMFAINSINSNAQDFLPGKFRNYQDRKVLIGSYLEKLYSDKEVFVKSSIYDIDGDSIPEVLELSLIKIKDDEMIVSENPYAYYLDLDPSNEYLKIFYDPEMDGWNNNEEIISDKEGIDYSYFKL